MANPNIVETSEILGKTHTQIATTGNLDFLVNSSGSNKILKVNTVMVGNVNATYAQSADLSYYDGSYNNYLAFRIYVPIGSSVALIGKDTPIYIEEGHKLQIKASAGGSLHFTVSYEIIS
jgi:hypothetical protein